MWHDRRSSSNNHQRNHNDHRTPFERDLTRVIHSPSFRRLQRKTQILGTDEGDFHRTRMTHSLEVSSIARSMVRNLRLRADKAIPLPSDDLISCISLLHDIGHPPFGHGGEVALNYMMHEHGGFESNGQTLRLISKTETSYGSHSLNLTRRTMLGILKYPAPYSQLVKTRAQPLTVKQLKIQDWLPPKSYFDCDQDVITWLLSPLPENDKVIFQSIVSPTETKHGTTLYKSLDCAIMNIADDIAYGVHDLEDAIHLKLITRDLIDNATFDSVYHQASADNLLPPKDTILNKLFAQDQTELKSMIGELVNFFIVCTEISVEAEQHDFQTPILKYKAMLKPAAKALLSLLKSVIFEHVIDSPEARTIEFGGQTVILRLFEAIQSNPIALLNLSNRKKFQEAENQQQRMRVICDYIASMSDEYAYRMHERLFGFNTRTIFERL